MSAARRGLRLSFATVTPILLATVGCGPARPTVPETPTKVEARSTEGETSPSLTTSFYGDATRVRFAGPANRVLVRRGSGPFVTGGQYNAWLGTYPLKLTSQDPVEARRQALEQMVTFKLLARKARESGYAEKMGQGGAAADERSMVIQYIKDQVSNVVGITDEDIKAYEVLHPEYVASLDASSVSAEMRAMVLRGSVAGERLWERVKTWMKEERIEYVDSPR